MGGLRRGPGGFSACFFVRSSSPTTPTNSLGGKEQRDERVRVTLSGRRRDQRHPADQVYHYYGGGCTSGFRFPAQTAKELDRVGGEEICNVNIIPNPPMGLGEAAINAGLVAAAPTNRGACSWAARGDSDGAGDGYKVHGKWPAGKWTGSSLIRLN